MKNKKEIDKILDALEELYPDAQCELNYRTPFELLVATMLSAQTTDIKVNQVTEKLFEKYKGPEEFVDAAIEELESDIKVIGLYRNKAKNLKKMSEAILTDYNGVVPDTKEELIKLAGVGTKTANVVLSNAFNVPAIAVDTHVFRVANRIGLAQGKDVKITEEQLRENIKIDRWSKAHHLLIFHGRRCCKARKPDCENCKINHYCEFFI
ncbi:endonuclease III [Oceanirhabdus sp. W0125-5]|uniref:endonuclease III n=1 Tax=Oceanirhabdus sp. W0125-5 TaxID=2999116 RepID=UPI0022F33AB6|nr:endonuclease III [Oceanirhabdus sp. W0125-5]WBW98527.1 endonuclease III [Oceanirhabdus sp. W0125-5]